MNLIEAKYENLDYNRKKIYKDYYDNALIVSHLTELLLNTFNDELIYLQPIFLEYSYDKVTYKNYKILLANIRKQTLAFENKILTTIDTTDAFSIDTQKILCIGNQIKVYINTFIDLLNQTDNPDLNGLIDSIFQETRNICTSITHYTRQCRLDKKLFNNDDDFISSKIQKHGLFKEDNEEKLPEIHNYRQQQISSNKTIVKHKESLPKNIKIDINNFLERINTFNPYDGTSKDVVIYRNNLCQDYNRITEMIKLYINQTKKLIIIQLTKVQESINQELLDYSIPGISFKNFNSLKEKMERTFNNLEHVNDEDKNKVLSEYLNLVQAIIKSNQLFKHLIKRFNTAKGLNHRIINIKSLLDDLETIICKCHVDLSYYEKILELYEKGDFEGALKYEEELRNIKGRMNTLNGPSYKDLINSYKYIYNNQNSVI